MNIAKVYDANVYVNNASKHGLASEITAPTITALMTDYKAMGMIGSAEFFNGFDKLETTIKWTYPDNDAQKAFGNFLKPVDLMIRSSKAEYDNTGITDEKPIVMYIRGYSKTSREDRSRPRRTPNWNLPWPSSTTSWRSTARRSSRST